MKTITHFSDNPEIEILEMHSDLTGNSALELRKYLYNCLDNGKYYFLIDFKRVKKVDDRLVNIIGDFGVRDILFRLFNVKEEVLWVIKRSGRSDVLRKIYDNIDNINALALFEKEVAQKRQFKKGSINRRRYPRSGKIDISAEFFYSPSENKMITGQLSILNICEGGALVGQIRVVNKLTGRTFRPLQINGHNLYGLKFRVKATRPIIETKVKCVREYIENGELFAGLIFLDLNEEAEKSIRDLVSSFNDQE